MLDCESSTILLMKDRELVTDDCFGRRAARSTFLSPTWVWEMPTTSTLSSKLLCLSLTNSLPTSFSVSRNCPPSNPFPQSLLRLALFIVSAGYDAAAGDELGKMKVSPAGYAHMTHLLSALSGGKVVLALEVSLSSSLMPKSTVN